MSKEFVGRVYTNKWNGYDITFTEDDLELLHSKLDDEGKVRTQISFGKESNKPYMCINTWKPQKKEEQPKQEAKPTSDENLPF